jgi:hypothetical protein
VRDYKEGRSLEEHHLVGVHNRCKRLQEPSCTTTTKQSASAHGQGFAPADGMQRTWTTLLMIGRYVTDLEVHLERRDVGNERHHDRRPGLVPIQSVLWSNCKSTRSKTTATPPSDCHHTTEKDTQPCKHPA